MVANTAGEVCENSILMESTEQLDQLTFSFQAQTFIVSRILSIYSVANPATIPQNFPYDIAFERVALEFARATPRFAFMFKYTPPFTLPDVERSPIGSAQQVCVEAEPLRTCEKFRHFLTGAFKDRRVLKLVGHAPDISSEIGRTMAEP
jgi:hypothetical protein